jgi:ABC-type nitrate/sulfonate/bicarbonate transport system substrate-binding protein
MGGHALTSCRDLCAIPEAGFSTSPAVIAEKPLVVKGMVRALLRGVAIARYSREETLDSILRHNHYITREQAILAYNEVHEEWGPVLDFEAYQRKVDFYTQEWNLPQKAVSDYYNFKYLKEALNELGMLHTWDPKMAF